MTQQALYGGGVGKLRGAAEASVSRVERLPELGPGARQVGAKVLRRDDGVTDWGHDLDGRLR